MAPWAGSLGTLLLVPALPPSRVGPVPSYLMLCCLYQYHRSLGRGMAKVPFKLRFPTFSLAPQPQQEQPADVCAFGSEFG